MEQIFGNLPAAARFAVPFLLVLGLVAGAALLWQRLRTAAPSATSLRGRGPRLAVIDTAVVDARRRLVLIRCDDAQHLLMIGGPTDIVIRSDIMRPEAAAPARDARPVTAPEQPIRQAESEPWSEPFETVTRAIRSLEELGGPRPDKAQFGAPEPIQEARQQPRQELVLASLAPAAPGPAGELPIAIAAVKAVAPPPAVDFPAPAPHALRPVPADPPAAARVSAPVLSSTSAPPRPSAPAGREPVIGAAPAPAREPPNASPPPEPKGIAPPAPPAAAEAARTPPPPRPAQNNDANLAELAQRLEAALRRPTRPAEQQAAVPALTPVATSRAATPLDPAAKTGAKVPSSSPPAPAAADHGEAAARLFEGIESEMAKMLERSLGNPPKP